MALLYFLRALFFPLTLAFLIYLAFWPFSVWLYKVRVPRALIIFLVIIAFVCIVSAASAGVYLSAKNLVSVLGTYTTRFTSSILSQSNVIGKLEARWPELIKLDLNSLIHNLDPSVVVGKTLGFSVSVVSIASTTFMVILFFIFLLIDDPLSPEKLHRLSKSQYAGFALVISRHARIVSRYLSVKTIISLATGTAIGVGMAVAGMDAPFLWGALSFLLNYIPSIGSVVSALIIITMAILQFSMQWGIVIWISIYVLAVQIIIGNFLDPHFVGNQLKLSSLVILISLVFWGILWGVGGMFIAAPLTVVLMALVREWLRPAAPGEELGKKINGEGLERLIRRHHKKG